MTFITAFSTYLRILPNKALALTDTLPAKMRGNIGTTELNEAEMIKAAPKMAELNSLIDGMNKRTRQDSKEAWELLEKFRNSLNKEFNLRIAFRAEINLFTTVTGLAKRWQLRHPRGRLNSSETYSFDVFSQQAPPSARRRNPPRIVQKISLEYCSKARPLSWTLQNFKRQSYQIVSRETLWYDCFCQQRASVCGI